MHKALVFGGAVAGILAAAKLTGFGPTSAWGWHLVLGAGAVVAVVVYLMK